MTAKQKLKMAEQQLAYWKREAATARAEIKAKAKKTPARKAQRLARKASRRKSR